MFYKVKTLIKMLHLHNTTNVSQSKLEEIFIPCNKFEKLVIFIGLYLKQIDKLFTVTVNF